MYTIRYRKVNYKIKQVKKTINFLEGIIQKTYIITKAIFKDGVVHKVTILNHSFLRGGTSYLESDQLFHLASQIQNVVLKLAAIMKKRVLKGALKIIFNQGHLVLELILQQCGINLDYEYV